MPCMPAKVRRTPDCQARQEMVRTMIVVERSLFVGPQEDSQLSLQLADSTVRL